jgi:thymidylate kinase
LLGETDLDLLIDKEDREKFNLSIETFNFKKILSPPHARYPGIEDYLGFDYETGSLIHLHVHYSLILGQKYIKNHHLPIENFVLNDTEIVNGVRIPLPEIELILLIVRANMKFSIVTYLKSFRHKKRRFYPQDILEEFFVLLDKCEAGKIQTYLERLPINLDATIVMQFIERLQAGSLDLKEVKLTRNHIFCAMRPFKRHNSFVCFFRALYRGFRRNRILKRILPLKKKTVYGGGKVFALVGADGAGKSTMKKDLSKWLSWKVAVRPIYFGIPKSICFKGFSELPRIFRLLGKIQLGSRYQEIMAFSEDMSNSMRWLLIARKRFNLFRASQNFAAEGGVVIADRYPLSAFSAMDEPMDGPRIRKQQKTKNHRFSEIEESYYSSIGLPSKIFVLNTPLELLLKRKTVNASNLGALKKKACAVNQIQNSENIYVINCNREYDEVLLDIKRRIWESL